VLYGLSDISAPGGVPNRAAVQKLPAGPWTATRIKLDTTVNDPGGNLTLGTEARYTAPAAGYYRIEGTVTGFFNTTGIANPYAAIYVNGTERIHGTGLESLTAGGISLLAAGITQLAKGDKVELWVNNHSSEAETWNGKEGEIVRSPASSLNRLMVGPIQGPEGPAGPTGPAGPEGKGEVSKAELAAEQARAETAEGQRVQLGSINAPFVRQVEHNEGAGASFTVNMPKGVLAGSTLLLLAQSELSESNITNVTSPGATWALVNKVTATGKGKGLCLDVWMATKMPAQALNYKVTVSQTVGDQHIAEIVEVEGVLELDAAQTSTSAFPTTTELPGTFTSGSQLVKGLTKAQVEALKVGWQIIGITAGTPNLAFPFRTTISELKPATGEVKCSAAAVETGTGVSIYPKPEAPSTAFGAGQPTPQAYDLVIAQCGVTSPPTGPGFFYTVPGSVNITPRPTGDFYLTGYGNGIACWYIGQSSPIQPAFYYEANVGSEGFYTWQVLAFKFPTGVAGLSAGGVLPGALKSSTGMLDPAVATPIPPVVSVGPGAWTNIGETGGNEVKIDKPKGSLQWRFEQSGTSVRYRGTLHVKAGVGELKAGEMLWTTPKEPATVPSALTSLDIAYGAGRLVTAAVCSTFAGQETTAETEAGKVKLKKVAKAVCEALGWGAGITVTGANIPGGTTIAKVEAAKEEVELSAAPTTTVASIAVTFGASPYVRGFTAAQLEPLAVGEYVSDSAGVYAASAATTIAEVKAATGELKLSALAGSAVTEDIFYVTPAGLTFAKALLGSPNPTTTAGAGAVRVPVGIPQGSTVYIDGSYAVP